MIEQRLIGMGEPYQVRKAECTGAALDRMDGAKYRIQPIAGPVTFLDCGKLLFELRQELGAFVEVGRLEVVEIAHLSVTEPFWVLRLISGRRGG